MQKCQELVALPPKTLRDVKALIKSSSNPDKLDQVIETELKLFAQALKIRRAPAGTGCFFYLVMNPISKTDTYICRWNLNSFNM